MFSAILLPEKIIAFGGGLNRLSCIEAQPSCPLCQRGMCGGKAQPSCTLCQRGICGGKAQLLCALFRRGDVPNRTFRARNNEGRKMVKENICKDWYVLQVMAGRERFVKQVLEQAQLPELRIIIFSREIIHKKENRDIQLSVPLFPGYIFIHKDIGPASEFLKNRLHREFVRPVAFGGKPAAVAVDEMQLLLANAGSDGTFPLSACQIVGDNVVVSGGPLKNIQGKILFINKKKKKAKVRFFLFRREMDISLGIDFVEKNEGNSCLRENLLFKDENYEHSHAYL